MENGKRMWGFMAHLGCNCYADHVVDHWGASTGLAAESHSPADHLRFDEEEWNFLVDRLVADGANMILLDLAEGLRYESHPELAAKGAWTKERLLAERRRLAAKGIELIPKLNFSAGHDTWLRDYHRMVSTPDYYRVCADLIAEVSELFEKPRLLHLGYDEETFANQHSVGVAMVRQGELWWRDFLWFNEQVKKAGSRAWIWSDYAVRHREEFLSRMPRDVVQSNWYYHRVDGEKNPKYVDRINLYRAFDAAGFDQIPCGSAYSWKANFAETVRHCERNMPGSPRILGYLLAPWTRVWNRFHEQNVNALEAFEAASRG